MRKMYNKSSDILTTPSIMKPYNLFLALTLIVLSVQLLAQDPEISFLPDVPRAGQALTGNPVTGFFQSGNREIDFDSLNMAFTGNWPAGQSFSISASPTGDTLFVGEGGRLLILDVSDPYNPALINEIHARAIIDHSYYDAATGRLFLAAYFSGIEVWSLGDFTTPLRLCRIPTNSYPRGGVFARGNYVYIATVADGFYVADISNPANPVMVAHCAVPGNTLIWDSDYQGNFAYLAAAAGGMRVIDFSNPLNPVIAGVFTGMTSGIRVRDTLAYIASSSLGLRILNVKDPSAITVAGSVTLPGSPSRLTLSGNYAYVANSTTATGGGVNVVDISNPSAPAHLNTFSSFQTFIAGRGGAIGATGGTEGCLVLDLSDPVNPVQAFAWPLAGFLYEVTVHGNYGYTGSNGFRVFDLSDKTNPIQVGFDPTTGELAAISDTLAVFIRKSMTANNPVQVMNIADPSQPFKMSQYMSPVMTWDIAIKDHYAFVGCWWDGVRVIDFSNPQNPVLKARRFGWSSGAVPGVDFCYVQALDIYGNYLFLVDYLPFPEEDTKGLYIFDITNPENLVFVSRYAALTSSGQDIKAWGDYVYVADGNGGMEVIDVSNPLQPFTAGYCNLPDGATGIGISWPFVMVSDYILGGVQVIDVTLPQVPYVTAFYKPSGCFAMGVTTDQNYVFIGDGVAGFQVYDLLTATITNEHSRQEDQPYILTPNPASSLITITSNKTGTGSKIFELFSLNGHLLFRQEITGQSTTANLSSIVPGTYLYRIFGEKTVQTGKIIRL